MKVSVTDLYETYATPRELAPFVECFWRWKTDEKALRNEVILPDATPELIVHLGPEPEAWSARDGWRRQPPAFVYCAAAHCLQLRIARPMDVFAVRFRPWGLSRFSARPMSIMLDRATGPSEALGELGESLVSAIMESGPGEGRAARAGTLLVDALQSRSDKAESIDILTEALGDSGEPARVMAKKLKRSSRTINRVWRELVGISPRGYEKLMRFHRALAQIEKGRALAAVAAECGFADQAHMARQIKEIAGLPPSQMRNWLGKQVYRDLYADRPGAPWQNPLSK